MSVISFNSFNASSYDENTVFVLDTNVLYFVHSGYYLPTNRKCIVYSNIIQQLIMSKFSICVSTLSLQELFYGIENKEYKLYCSANSIDTAHFTKKQFRNIPTEREKVKNKIEQVMSEISVYQLQDGLINSEHIDDFISSYELHKMDPIDFAIVKNNNIEDCVFVTDDQDFSSLSEINILTM